MDIPSTSGSLFRHSEDELDRSTQRDSSDYDDDDDDDGGGGGGSGGVGVGVSVSGGCGASDADEGASSGLGTMQSLSISSDGNKTMISSSSLSQARTLSTASSTSSKIPQKKKHVWEEFTWLLDVERSTIKCLGAMTELKSTTILNEIDFLLRKLTEDYPKYCKLPRWSYLLSRYVREFLYTYRYLNRGFEQDKDYLQRVTKLLAIYTDLELCGSISGMEWESDIINRIQLFYRTHLEYAEEFTILDALVRMKRLNRMHHDILTQLLKHFLVKISVKEPVEVDDDVFIKYLIVFKKWLAIEESSEEKEDVRSAFLSQAKPKKTFRTNPKYAPHLPPIASDTAYNYVLLLDKKFSLQPLLQAVDAIHTSGRIHEPSPSQNRKPNEVVVLSDDEASTELPSVVNIKMEPRPHKNAVNTLETAGLIDLTEDIGEEADIPRHHVSWLSDLLEKAKITPSVVEQPAVNTTPTPTLAPTAPAIATTSSEEPTESGQTTSAKTDDASVGIMSVNTTDNNAGTVLTSTRADVGTHWNSSFDDKRNEMCTASVEVRDGVTHQLPLTTNNQHEQASNHGHVNPKSNDEKSIECNAFSVTSTDGNHALPNCLASGSISSCSDEAAEELLTVAFKNQKLTERSASDFTDKKQTMIHDSTSNRSINKKVTKPSDVDCTVESTSYIESTTTTTTTNQSDNLPEQSNIHEPSTSSSLLSSSTSIYKRMQFLNDKILTVNFDNKKQDDIIQYGSEEYATTESGVDDIIINAPDDINVKRIITVVHPIRHKQIPQCDDGFEFPQDMTSRISSNNNSSSLSQSSILPMGGVKPKSILSKNMPPSSTTTTRLAPNLFVELDTNNQQVTSNSEANTTAQQRRHIETPVKLEVIQSDVDNHSIPSTIMERKTYIKKTGGKTMSTGPRIVATIKPPIHIVRSPPTSTTTQLAAAPSSSKAAAAASSSSVAASTASSSTILVTTTTIPTPAATVATDLLDCPTSSHKLQKTATIGEQHVSPSKATQQQPYKLFYSGTEIELGFNDIGSPLSECASPDSNLQSSSLTTAICESDNNLPHSSNNNSYLSAAMKLSGPSASLPSAIVHPLGLEHNSKHATKCNVKAAADRAALIETLSGTSVQSMISSDERSSVEDPIDSCDNLTTASSSEGELDSRYKPEYMLQIYKELGDHLKTMGFKPKSEIKTKTRTKRLMNAASRFLEAEEHTNESSNCSPEPTDENDGEGDASLPFKKRRKLPVFSDTIQLIKEEEYDSQPPSESPASLPSLHEIEVASAAPAVAAAAASLPSPALPPVLAPSLQPPPPSQLPASANHQTTSVGTSMSMNDDTNQPIAHMERVSYPPTPMLSIANIVEYLPVRAYSTFKTPAPEMTPVRFNILPQQTMVINNAPPPTNTAVPSASNAVRPSTNQHVEFGTTFNLIQPPPSQNIASMIDSNQANTLAATAAANTNINSTMNCGIVASDSEYLTPSMQAIASDNTASGFNVAQYHHPSFHSNSPYAATYSIQPAHTNPNSLTPNFDIQNMFNLRNYQMNPQHYHNLLQNSRINFQEKKSVLLNDYINNTSNNNNNNNSDGAGQENMILHSGGQQHLQQQQQQHQQQQQQYQHHQQPPPPTPQQQLQQLQQQHQSHAHIQPSVETKATATPINNKSMAPRTKAARKMVAENVTVAAISTNDKLTATTQSNRVTRSSIRTTRAQQVIEQKSPRRKTNRHR